MPDPLYLGLISGTSLDGIDVALIRRHATGIELLSAATVAYPPPLRQRLLIDRHERPLTARELGSLDVAVGKAFGAAANHLLADYNLAPAAVRAIGSHGQTILHHPELGFSLQIGDPARIARITGITTVADFRRADLAAGGEGAPLAPALHRFLFGADESRAILNLGGIANLTLLIPGQPVVAFDVGPANTLLDALARISTGNGCDRDGRLAGRGRVDSDLLGRLLDDPWFRRPPPKSTGPEYFNLHWLRTHMASRKIADPDLAATLCELTAASVAAALVPHPKALYCCGGGVHNPVLMRRLAVHLPATKVLSTAALGYDPDYIEAICFAWLAGERLSLTPANLPEVTGAEGSAVLGAVYVG